MCGAGLCLLAFASACVTQGRYDELEAEHARVSQESARLKERVDYLSTQLEQFRASNSSLDEERSNLIDELETLRTQKQKLEEDRQGLQELKDALSAELSAKSIELAKREAELDRIKGTYRGLVEDLESEIAAGQIQIQQLKEGVRLNLPQQVLFGEASADLGPQGTAVLEKVAAKLKNQDARIEVLGHTDNVPIRGTAISRYPTNWELAGARAASVVRVLERAGVAPNRLSAVSMGSEDPIASNETPEGRALNRRIEIRVLGGAEASVEVEPTQSNEAGAKAGEADAVGGVGNAVGSGHDAGDVPQGDSDVGEGNTDKGAEAPAMP